MIFRQLLQGFFQTASGPAPAAAPASHTHLDDILITACAIGGRTQDRASLRIAAESLLAMDMALAAGQEDGSVASEAAGDYRSRLVRILEGKGYKRAEHVTDNDRAALPERLRPYQMAIALGLSEMAAPGGMERPGALSREAAVMLGRADDYPGSGIAHGLPAASGAMNP